VPAAPEVQSTTTATGKSLGPFRLPDITLKLKSKSASNQPQDNNTSSPKTSTSKSYSNPFTGQMSLKDRIVDNRHAVMHAGSYSLWFMAHTFLLCVTAGESWVVINNPAGSSISDTSPFLDGDNGYGSPATAALLCVCVVISSFGLLVDKFIPTKNLGRALPSVISISLIIVGLLLLTAMSIYTNAYDADATVWGWSYGLGWATVWIYIVAGVGYYFGYDPEKDED